MRFPKLRICTPVWDQIPFQHDCEMVRRERYLQGTRFTRLTMKPISLRLPDDVASRLENLANLSGRTKTRLVLEAICLHLDEMEDIYISVSRLEELRSGKVKALSLESVIAKHGVDP
ncbi:MAG: hypothetical protein OXG08_00480 [Gammaproteobacteria bacterium]|nr:hypothetical protein [Gammaproteobacteria bacterium]